MHRPARPVLLAAAGVLVLLLVVAVAGVAVVSLRGTDAEPDPVPPVTTLGQLEEADPVVPRGSFCERVPSGRVQDALGDEVADARDYANGDPAPLGSAGEDVAHEYGCLWTSVSGAVARAWVFAPPVTPGRATRLTRLAGRAPGCVVDDRPAFGDPSVATTCTDTGSGAVTSAQQGLFGDAWLTCTLTSPTGETALVQARSDAWCVAVAVAAASD